MIRILFDTDAFLCARKLGLLAPFLMKQQPDVRFYMTQFIARHELATISQEIDALCAIGLLSIQAVPSRTLKQHFPRSDVRKRRGLDDGEAEAIAWAMGLPKSERPLFISNDEQARNGAKRHGVPAGDLMDFVVAAMTAGILQRDDVKRLAVAWDDKEQQQCRPRDWDGFDSTFARRQAQRE